MEQLLFNGTKIMVILIKFGQFKKLKTDLSFNIKAKVDRSF